MFPPRPQPGARLSTRPILKHRHPVTSDWTYSSHQRAWKSWCVELGEAEDTTGRPILKGAALNSCLTSGGAPRRRRRRRLLSLRQAQAALSAPTLAEMRSSNLWSMAKSSSLPVKPVIFSWYFSDMYRGPGHRGSSPLSSQPKQLHSSLNFPILFQIYFTLKIFRNCHWRFTLYLSKSSCPFGSCFH